MIFDLKTLKVTGHIKTGGNPDCNLYDPASKHIFTMNGKSNDASVIDPATVHSESRAEQEWLDLSFSPQGSTRETEDYQVNLDSVSVLELALKPDLAPANAFATLASWRMM